MNVRDFERQGQIAVLIYALIAATFVMFSHDLFNDGDTSWHLAAGKLILSSGEIPRADPFSFTFFGSPWTAHEWLAEVLMAGALQLGSWGGLSVLIGAAIFALLLLLGLETARWLSPARTIAVLAIVSIILTPSVLARPHVLAWPILAGWVMILMRAQDKGRAPPLVAAALMLVWANLHGSFILGLLLIGVFGLESLLQRRDRQTFIGWGVFGLVSLVLAILTPHGLQGLLFPLQVSSMKSLPLIIEWRRTSLSEDWLFIVMAALVGLLLLYRRPRLPIVRLMLLAVLVYLAFAHARHQALLAIIGTLLLVKPLSSGDAEPAKPARPALAPMLSAVIMLILVGAIRIAIPQQRQDNAAYPMAAIESVPAELRAAPVFNNYSFGGPLILAGIRPFIDGRADLYGDAFMFDYQDAANADPAAVRRLFDRWNIRWTILAPDDALVPLLDRQKQWRRIYADQWAVVHARQPR